MKIPGWSMTGEVSALRFLVRGPPFDGDTEASGERMMPSKVLLTTGQRAGLLQVRVPELELQGSEKLTASLERVLTCTGSMYRCTVCATYIVHSFHLAKFASSALVSHFPTEYTLRQRPTPRVFHQSTVGISRESAFAQFILTFELAIACTTS